MVVFSSNKLILFQLTTKHLLGCCLKRGAVTVTIRAIDFKSSIRSVQPGSRTTPSRLAPSQEYSGFIKDPTLLLQDWSALSHATLAYKHSVLCLRSPFPGTGHWHRSVHTLIQIEFTSESGDLLESLLQTRPKKEDVILQQCSSYHERFRLISRLPITLQPPPPPPPPLFW